MPNIFGDENFLRIIYKRTNFVLVVVAFLVSAPMLPMVSASSQTQPASGDEDEDLPKVMFLTTGGTIANRENPDGTSTRIQLPEVMDNIRERYPQPDVAAVLDSIDPTFKEVALIGSEDFDLQEFLTISWEAQKALDGEFDAVIVTQGTFSSEYTCYFLNLLVNSEKPIIVTNSQRGHMSVGNDGDMNLLKSILVATNPESPGKGALQVENDKIMGCREVTKDSARPGAFMAGHMGVLGWVPSLSLDTEVNAVFYHESTRKHTSTSEFSINDLVINNNDNNNNDNNNNDNNNVTFKQLPRVEVLPSFYGAQPDVVDALVSLDVEGIVIQGLASSGGAFMDQAAELEELAEDGMPIVRTHSNQVAYDSRISPSDGPFIGGDNLPSHKARILLQLAMEKTEDLDGDERRDEIQRLFNTH